MVRIAVENHFNLPTLSVYRHVTKGDNSPLFNGNQVMPMEKKTTRWSELLKEEQIEQVTQILGKELLSQLGYATSRK